MNEFQYYSLLYPNIPIEVLIFFSELKEVEAKHKHTVHAFCVYYKEKYNTENLPQPRLVSRMCEILCENSMLSVLSRGGPDNMHNIYYCNLDKKVVDDPLLSPYFNKKLSYVIYGFKHIYEEYKKYVLPVEFTNKNDDISLGTCFLYDNGRATAKHCIEGAKKIAISGFSKEELEKATYQIHRNDLMDLIYIRFENPVIDTIMFSKPAEILDEIMTLGYPKISGFHSFLTAENATVSSRFTTSVGQIASEAVDIWIKEKLFLITAKIRGGNSGGPVISKDGSVVGIAANLTEGDGDYDELGYGTVIPVSFLNELINTDDKVYLDVKKTEFKDFN